jgi:hypothetical protein
MSKSKRFKAAGVVTGLNFATFWLAMYLETDLSAAGTGLALINAPLLGYLMAETKRAST